jgi:hypothetical protein
MNQTPDKEKHQTVYVDSIDDLMPISNMVLCRSVKRNVGSRTKNGVIISSEYYHMNDYLPVGADRVMEIIKVPEIIQPRAGMWMPEIELQPGDIAWCSFIGSLNCVHILDKSGVIYKLIEYFDFKVVRRKTATGEDIIPLNGFVLMKDVYIEKPKISDLDIVEFKPTIDYTRGIVAYIGKPNKYYTLRMKNGSFVKEDLESKSEIKAGDKVIFDDAICYGKIHPYLENKLYKCFDGDNMYFFLQRKDIAFIEN